MSGEDKGELAETNEIGAENALSASAPPPASDGHVEAKENGADHSQELASKRSRFPKDIKTAEWIMIVFTAITAIASWAGVYVANRQAQLGAEQLAFAEKSARDSGNDTRAALRISDRTATASEKQAAAAADSAEAARRTAGLVKGQTEATVQQANALIASANATVTATGAQLGAAQAQLQAAGAVAATAIPVVRFGGMQISGIKSEAKPNGMVDFTVSPYFLNVGNVSIVPRVTILHLIFSERLPLKPILRTTLAFGGNDIAIPANIGFGVGEPQPMTVDKVMRNELIKRKLRIFAWGEASYSDTRGGPVYKECFLVETYPDNDDWDKFSSVRLSDPAYKCEPTQENR